MSHAGSGSAEKAWTPNFRSYLSQLTSGRSYLGPGCTRQPRALLFLTGCNVAWGFLSLGDHILVLTLLEASVNSLSFLWSHRVSKLREDFENRSVPRNLWSPLENSKKNPTHSEACFRVHPLCPRGCSSLVYANLESITGKQSLAPSEPSVLWRS